MRLLTPLLAALVFLLGGWLGMVSDAIRAEEATPRPPPGPSSVLGGFSAIAVQVLWIRGDRALRLSKLERALYYFNLIHQLEPQLLSASSYFADEIGRSIADRYPDPEARAALGMLSLSILERSQRHNPDDYRAHVLRGRFLLTRVALEPAMAAELVRRSGRTARDIAQNDFANAYELAPESIEATDGFALASKELGIELFLLALGGDREAAGIARSAFTTSVAAYDHLLELQERKLRASPDFQPSHLELLAPERGAQEVSRRCLAVLDADRAEAPALYRALWEELGRPNGWPAPE